MNYAAMGLRIRNARKAKHWTQAELAERCSMSTAFCGHIERGTRVPSLDTLARLCIALDVSADMILDLEHKETLPDVQHPEEFLC